MANKRIKKPTTRVGRAILRATNLVGGTTSMRAILGLESQQQVSNWIYRQIVPPEYCLRIQFAVRGRVLASELNPECFDRARAMKAVNP